MNLVGSLDQFTKTAGSRDSVDSILTHVYPYLLSYTIKCWHGAFKYKCLIQFEYYDLYQVIVKVQNSLKHLNSRTCLERPPHLP